MERMDRYYFLMNFGGEIMNATKISAEEFSEKHREIIRKAEFDNKQLILSDRRWRSTLLGAGEEKAVYAVCDEENRVFALELLDERYYLNGRFFKMNSMSLQMAIRIVMTGMSCLKYYRVI